MKVALEVYIAKVESRFQKLVYLSRLVSYHVVGYRITGSLTGRTSSEYYIGKKYMLYFNLHKMWVGQACEIAN